MAGVHRGKKVIGESLAILEANGDNLTQTAKALNLPKATLQTWRERYAGNPDVIHYRTLKNAELADRFRVISAMATERLIDEMQNVSVDKLATVGAIGTDKQLLLTGQATLITQNTNDNADAFALVVRKLRPDLTDDDIEQLRNESLGRIEHGPITDESRLIG